MAKKKRGLGRGLDALIGDLNKASEPVLQNTAENGERTSLATQPGASSNEHLKEIPIELLQSGKYQPRKDMHPEALEELAVSIKAQGLMQPIVVRPVGEGKYEIIAGERRWRQRLGGVEGISRFSHHYTSRCNGHSRVSADA